MTRSVLWISALTLFAVGLGCAPDHGNDPTGILLANEWIGNIDRVDFREPSGIAYHAGRGTLFAVGDEGDICEIRTDGTPVRHKVNDAERIDYEGITVAPDTGLLYVAVEGAEAILEIDPDTLATRRRFTLDRTFGGKVVMDPKGQGIEGIAFVPDPSHREGGTFYVTNQAFDLDNPTDISAIIEIELPLKTASGDGTGRTLRVLPMPVIDLAGLHYDGETQRLLVASDATNTLWVVTLDGRIERGYALIGESQEGIAIDPDGHLYIAQDQGGIVKVRWLRPQ